MKVAKPRWPISFILVLLLALFGLTYTGIFHYYRQARQAALQSYTDQLKNEYHITTQTFTEIADLIFATQVNNEKIKTLFFTGLESADETEQNRLRRQLYQDLSGLYEIMKTYDFRQLHFHDRHNISYLRFHRPDTFGDDLTGIRYSVEYVNREKNKIAGFEEGRILNGYRYVYPLLHQDEHIGSVELSISMENIIRKIHQIFGQEVQFLLLKSQMEKKVFTEEMTNYVPWGVDDRYVLDRAISEICILEGKISEHDKAEIRQMIDLWGPEGGSFSLEINVAGTAGVIAFIPIKNFFNENVAYLFALSGREKLEDIARSFAIITAVYIILLALILFLGSYYILSRNKIEKIMKIDHLTKADTRGVLMEKITAEHQRYLRYKRPYSISIIDIDHFKKINDSYGHLAGDDVLRTMADLVNNHLRSCDGFGRYGGEEFIILLPETALREAVAVSENIRQLIQNHDFPGPGTVTVSMGVAEIHTDISSIDDLIDEADRRLYRAKAEGRNKVCYERSTQQIGDQ